MPRRIAVSVYCPTGSLKLGPIADGQFLKKEGDKIVGASAGGDSGVEAHEQAVDPHPGYLTQSEADALYAGVDAPSDEVSTHEGASDPHPTYLKQAEADALYDASGDAAAEVAAHEGLADPHTQYQKESEKGQANGYASLDGSGKVPSAQLPASQGSGITVEEALEAAYPVGSVYISVVSTNPGTLLGIGTWSAFAAGRMLVGINSGDADFDTAEETGGSKTSSAVVNHTHSVTITDPGHSHNQGLRNSGTAGTAGIQGASTANNATITNGVPSATTGITASTANPAGGVASFSLMNPYIAVYMWKRTA